MELRELLYLAIKNKASDLHLSADLQPMLRINGQLKVIDMHSLSHKDIKQMLVDFMNVDQQKEYLGQLELDFAIDIPNLARFRINAFHQARGAAATFRIIPNDILTLDELGLPQIFKNLVKEPSGLILLTGPSGSGKSTTLAAMIDYLNNTQCYHILTIEDPIEFIHTCKNSLINQRQVHQHSLSFNAALRSALREDPDIIMIGELRDLETIRLAMTAAETGHLVLASLHTNSASQTINRIIDVFPAAEKTTIRSMLAQSLQAVIAQRLLKKIDSGLVAAFEILICTGAIRHLIREDKTAQIYSAIQTGQSKGMQTLDQHLIQLVNDNVIDVKTAQSFNQNLLITA